MEHVRNFTSPGLSPFSTTKVYPYSHFLPLTLRLDSGWHKRAHKEHICYPPALQANTPDKIKHVSHSTPHHLLPSPGSKRTCLPTFSSLNSTFRLTLPQAHRYRAHLLHTCSGYTHHKRHRIRESLRIFSPSPIASGNQICLVTAFSPKPKSWAYNAAIALVYNPPATHLLTTHAPQTRSKTSVTLHLSSFLHRQYQTSMHDDCFLYTVYSVSLTPATKTILRTI